MAKGINGQGFVKVLANPEDKFPRIRFAGSRCRQGLSILLIDLNPFFHCLAELLIYLGLIVAVNTAKHKSRACPNVTLVLF